MRGSNRKLFSLRASRLGLSANNRWSHLESSALIGIGFTESRQKLKDLEFSRNVNYIFPMGSWLKRVFFSMGTWLKNAFLQSCLKKKCTFWRHMPNAHWENKGIFTSWACKIPLFSPWAFGLWLQKVHVFLRQDCKNTFFSQLPIGKNTLFSQLPIGKNTFFSQLPIVKILFLAKCPLRKIPFLVKCPSQWAFGSEMYFSQWAFG